MHIHVVLHVTPDDSEKMPQTNKSQSGGCVPGQVSAPDQGEPPPASADAKAQGADGGAGGGAGDKGDVEIIKSPSDPKKYRWETQVPGLNVSTQLHRRDSRGHHTVRTHFRIRTF